jgi:predicted MFS family arabinose efflux permease
MDCTELRLGWRAILGVTVALLSGIACLPYYTASLFVTSLQHEFGWSRAAISLGPSMLALGQVVTTPFIGILVDRIDARKLVPFGVLIVALAFGWLSIMNGSFLQYFAAMSLMAFIGGLATGTTATRIIAETFRSSRGAALGIVLSGIGLGAAAGSTLVARVIHTYGWRGGYLAMGLFSLTMTPLIHLLLRGRGRVSPSPDSYSGDTLREAFSKPLYWCLSDAFFFVSLGSAGLIIHFVPLLTDRGMNAKEAAAIASVIYDRSAVRAAFRDCADAPNRVKLRAVYHRRSPLCSCRSDRHRHLLRRRNGPDRVHGFPLFRPALLWATLRPNVFDLPAGDLPFASALRSSYS